MRARSRVVAWLSYPDVKAARAALAAGSLAGLAVLGACSEGTVTSKVVGPPVSEPSFVGVVGANSHTVQVCVDPASAVGTYSFAVSNSTDSTATIGLELTTSSDPDLVPPLVSQNSQGPFNPGDIITAAPSIVWDAADVLAGVPECIIVFQRNETATHTNNRIWDFGGSLGIVNPHGSVNVDLGTLPAGYTYTATCLNDDPILPQTDGCDTTPGGIIADPIISSANVFHGSVITYLFVAGTANPPLFIILDEDAIDNGLEPNFFKAKDVNDQIAKLGQRKELKFFDENEGLQIVLWSGRMGDEGWFAPKFIPESWATTGPDFTDGLRNFIGLPVGPGLGVGPGDKEKYLDKIPDVTPLRAEGLFMLIGRTLCAVVYDSDISINYNPLNGSLKGATLGIAAFTVNNVEQLFGVSSSSLPKVTITIEDADTVCAGDQELFLDAPIPLTSSTLVDIVPDGDG